MTQIDRRWMLGRVRKVERLPTTPGTPSRCNRLIVSPVERLCKHGLALAALLVLGAGLIAPAALAQDGETGEADDLLGRLFGRAAQQAVDDEVTTLSVRGSSQISVPPDRAVLTLGVTTRADGAEAALDANSTALEAVIDALLEAGVSEDAIETSVFSLFPEEAPDGPRPEEPAIEGQAAATGITGYRVTNSLTVTTDELDEIGALIEAAVTAGANEVRDIGFQVADPERHRAQALAAAVDAALADAEVLARALDAEIARVVELRTGDGGRVVEEAAAFDRAGAPPIRPGELSIGASVEMTLELTGVAADVLLARQAEARATATAEAAASAIVTATETITAPVDATPAEVPLTDNDAGDASPASDEDADAGAGAEGDAAADDEASGAETDAESDNTTEADEGEASAQDEAAASDPPGGAGTAVDAAPVAQAPLARYRGSRARAVLAASASEWSRALAPLLPRALEVDADFDDEVLAGVFLGQKSTDGYGLAVERVTLEDGVLVFSVRVTEPGAEEAVSNVSTSPFQVLRLPREGLPDDIATLETEVRELRGR